MEIPVLKQLADTLGFYMGFCNSEQRKYLEVDWEFVYDHSKIIYSNGTTVEFSNKFILSGA